MKALDACNNAATGKTVTIALGANPSNASLSGTLTRQTDAAGVATFDNLKISKPGLGYTLAATGSASASSTPFDVFDQLCVPGSSCSATDAAGTTGVTTTTPPAGATMGLSFGGAGGTFTCDGTSRSVIGSQVTVVPDGYTQPIKVTFTWDKSVLQQQTQQTQQTSRHGGDDDDDDDDDHHGGSSLKKFVFCLSKDDGAHLLRRAEVRQVQPGADLREEAGIHRGRRSPDRRPARAERPGRQPRIEGQLR